MRSLCRHMPAQTASVESGDLLPAPEPPPAAQPAPPVVGAQLLVAGRVQALRLPVLRRAGAGAAAGRASRRQRETPTPARTPAADRGVLVHDLLERLDFRRPAKPDGGDDRRGGAAGRPRLALSDADAAEAAAWWSASLPPSCAPGSARATQVAREERFAFLLGGALVVGALDVLAREPGGRSLVVDYKTDRLEGADPREVVDRAYATQRLVYALAALRAGADGGRGRARVPGRRARAGHRDVLARRTRRSWRPAVGAGRRRHAARVRRHRRAASRRLSGLPGGGRAVLMAAGHDQARRPRPAVLNRRRDGRVPAGSLNCTSTCSTGERSSTLASARSVSWSAGPIGIAEQASRPQLARDDDVDLGRVEGQLRAEMQPDQQRDHERELGVGVARSACRSGRCSSRRRSAGTPTRRPPRRRRSAGIWSRPRRTSSA